MTQNRPLRFAWFCLDLAQVLLPGVDFIDCFAPCTYILSLAPNFGASKELLKSWAQVAKDGCKGAKPVMKSTPGRVQVIGNLCFTLSSLISTLRKI